MKQYLVINYLYSLLEKMSCSYIYSIRKQERKKDREIVVNSTQ